VETHLTGLNAVTSNVNLKTLIPIVCSDTRFKCVIFFRVPRNFVINILTLCGGQSYSQTVWKQIVTCNQDTQATYPQFLYSTGTSSGDPHNWIGKTYR